MKTNKQKLEEIKKILLTKEQTPRNKKLLEETEFALKMQEPGFFDVLKKKSLK